MVNFTHLSESLLGSFITPVTLGHDMKPHGCLWLSYKDDWLQYVKDEVPDLYTSYRYQYNVNIDLDQLIVLDSWAEVKDFHQEYAIQKRYHKVLYIDWDKVRSTTDKCGVLVNAPFPRFDRRNENIIWPYTFDVCSVAVWGRDCIVSVSKPLLL